MALERRTFIQQLGLGAAGLTMSSVLPMLSVSRESATHTGLPRSEPETQGLSSSAVMEFLAAVEEAKLGLHSLMIVRHGYIVAEGWWSPYRPSAPHWLYSLSKSFTSTAVGFAVTEGKLRAEDRVIDFFQSQLPATVSDHLVALTVRDLLIMSVGRAEDSTRIMSKDDDWVKGFLSLPIENLPGSVFLYDSGASYMLSAIVQEISGRTLMEYLQPRFFDPLGLHGMSWETCPHGINTGGWGLTATTEAVAKFGQFYLQRGRWGGRQLLPPEWIAEATSFKIRQSAAYAGRPGADLEELKQTSDWHQGYGYQFHLLRHNAYRGVGGCGQNCIVMPEQDAVVVFTGEVTVRGDQDALNLVWKHLLPAMHPRALDRDRGSQVPLARHLARLALQPPAGSASVAAANRISGRRFELEPNSLGLQNVSLRFAGTSALCELRGSSDRVPVHCGLGKWIDGEATVPGALGSESMIALGRSTNGLRPLKVAAAGGWQDESTFVMQWRYYETPHHDRVICSFDGDRITVELLSSVSQLFSVPETRPVMHGRIVA